MDHSPHSPLLLRDARRIRIDTLSRLRWMAIGGQLATVLVTAFVLKFQFPAALCLGVIGLSVALNLTIRFKFSRAHRLDEGQAALLLAFDILQLTGLLYLTGGLENPFAILFLAPVTIAAVSTPRRELVLLFGLMAICATVVGLRHLPLPGFEAIYAERAPVGHVTDKTCPILLLQGLDDPVEDGLHGAPGLLGRRDWLRIV